MEPEIKGLARFAKQSPIADGAVIRHPLLGFPGRVAGFACGMVLEIDDIIDDYHLRDPGA